MDTGTISCERRPSLRACRIRDPITYFVSYMKRFERMFVTFESKLLYYGSILLFPSEFVCLREFCGVWKFMDSR